MEVECGDEYPWENCYAEKFNKIRFKTVFWGHIISKSLGKLVSTLYFYVNEKIKKHWTAVAKNKTKW